MHYTGFLFKITLSFLGFLITGGLVGSDVDNEDIPAVVLVATASSLIFFISFSTPLQF